jgi:hypothetical protein
MAITKQKCKRKRKVTPEQLHQDFLNIVERMNHNSVFEIKNLTRKVSPYLSTGTLANDPKKIEKYGNIFFLRARYSKKAVRCKLLPETSNGNSIVQVITTLSLNRFDYTFYCRSHKQLLEKLIKHDLL